MKSLQSSFPHIAVYTGSSKATALTPTLHQPRGRVPPPPPLSASLRLSPWLHTMGGPTDEDVMIMMMMVLVVIVCPRGFCFRIRTTILRSWPLSPTLGRHLPGEKSTQQELEGLGWLYVCSPEQGCVWLICLSFLPFYKYKASYFLPTKPGMGTH